MEQTLLLPKDMADLRSMRKHEVFLGLKRDLAMVRAFFFSLPRPSKQFLRLRRWWVVLFVCIRKRRGGELQPWRLSRWLKKASKTLRPN